jgi:spermidine/putrescine-binding protein
MPGPLPPSSPPRRGRLPIPLRLCLLACLLAALGGALGACGRSPTPAPRPAPTRTPPLTFYNWSDDTPPAVLAAFAQATNTPANVVVYETEEEGLARLRAGAPFDLAVVPNHQVGSLIDAGLLAPIDPLRLPNFRNITPSFRGLIYDPDNRYSVPYTWGIVGLIARRDLLPAPPRLLERPVGPRLLRPHRHLVLPGPHPHQRRPQIPRL